MTEAVDVRGGTGGIDAHCDDMVAVAGLYGRAAADTAEVSWSLQRYLLDLGTIGTAFLDPVGAAAYEFDLARALDGPHGVSRLALECAAVAAGLRSAAAAYRAADRLDSTAHTVLDGLADLPAATVQAGSTLLRTGDPARAAQRLVTADPGLADAAATAAVAAGASVPSLVTRAMTADGHPVVQRLGQDTSAAARRPPRTVADLVEALSVRNAESAGEIDVRLLSHGDGRRSVIVDIPGTKSWTPLPTADVTSVVTDVRAMAGHSTSYERGVLEALRQAGVRPDDEVMLVGHSEGGMVAVQTAIDATAAGTFRITHVVTAGSPIGRTAGHVPSSVAVLALENAGDIVPRLDASANPPAPNVTTVSLHRDHSTIADNHDIDASYLPGAHDVDASEDVSVREFVGSAGAFLGAQDVRTERFAIRRAY